MEKITQIVFIDPSVEDYQSLAQSTEPNTETLILDRTGDGVEQITQLLANYTNISAVHIISHGGPGSLQLGAMELNSGNLDEYGDRFEQWKKALSPNADLLIYGCNVAAQIAQPIAELSFLQRLNQLTGADIGASKTLTGSAQLGGNWDLEVTIGSIDTDLAFSQEAIANYSHVLATFGVTNTNDSGPNSLRDAITQANATPGADIIDLTGITGTIALASALPIINESLSLNGPGVANLTVSGNSLFQILSTNNGPVSISNLTFANGGGAINNASGVTLNLTNVNFSSNTAGLGAALFNQGGTVTIAGSTFTANTVNGSGGGAIRQGGGTLSIVDSTFTENTANAASQGGGAILIDSGAVNITGCTFAGNSSQNTDGGGAIYHRGGGELLSIVNSTFTNNISAADGGAIRNDAQPLTVTSSTFNGNRATQNAGAIRNDGVATITNSTFSANTAANFGAIRNGGTLNLSSSTLTLNTATNQGGGIFNTLTANVRNTIIAGNTAPLNPDVDGTFTSQGNNLIGNSGPGTGFTNGVNGDQVGTAGTPINPNLGALKNNGGPTQTHAPNLGSLAIDRGNSAIALTTDQRNLTRLSGSNVDIGAVEIQQIVSITAPDNSASETPIDPGTFRISRSASTVGNLTVNLAIDASSTAIAADYNLSSTFPVTIPNGQSFVDVILTPVDDAIPELAETLRLNLVNGNYAIAPASGNATVTITANDSIAYAIALTNPATGSLTEGNSGTKPVTFTVTRSGGTGVASTVNYAIAGTATNGADYNNINAAGANSATGAIAFAANETTKTISVDVLGETLVEPDETITVTLSNPNLTAAPESSTITANTATATITNDDTPLISINNVVVTEGNTGTVNATFTASLSAVSNLPVTVNYATADGTATTADSDYTAATGSVSFAAGETTKTIAVAVNGDAKLETDETFNVNL
ncbi:MAG: DUF4347 domain-containing protein, partial [Oscillatoriales cyanobacterium]